MTKNWKIF